MKNKLFDKELRARILADPNTVVPSIVSKLVSDGVSYKAVESSKDITYFVIPSNNPMALSQLSAGNIKNFGTAGSAGSVGTIGTVCTSVGTYGTVGSLASYGSVDINI